MTLTSIVRLMCRYFYRAESLLPLPALDAEPDRTGEGLGINYWLVAMGENREVPGIGDVVIHLDSCSMGATVRRDVRYRVKGPGPYERSVIGETANGALEILHAFYMRRHTKLHRTWFLCN